MIDFTLPDWPTIKVKELATHITVGFVGSMSSLFADEGVPLLRGQNIKPYNLDLNNLKFISNETHRKWKKSSLLPGDVAIVRVGYPGTACVIPKGIGPLNAASLVIVRPDQARLNPYFLCYILNSPWGKASISGLLVGAAQQVFNTKSAANLKIRCPPLGTQRKIASILSAYDDLIENNTLRIAIAEEMARAIYCEWFVNFRFPGHKNVKLVESPLGMIPEGWEAKKLGDAIELLYGKSLRAADRKGGDVAVYGSSGIIGYHDEFLTEGPGIVVGRKGNVGSVFWSDISFYPIDTAFYVKTELPLHYVYFNLLLSQQFLNSDAAVPGLNRNQAYSNPLIVPENGLLESFTQQIEPILALTRLLRSRNDNLRTTRDLLIPKLISGKLDVEALDIEISEFVAELEEVTT